MSPYVQVLFTDTAYGVKGYHELIIVKTRGNRAKFRIEATIKNGNSGATLEIMMPAGNWEKLEDNTTIMGKVKIPSYVESPRVQEAYYAQWYTTCLEYLELVGY